jgi:hypothetical protein
MSSDDILVIGWTVVAVLFVAACVACFLAFRDNFRSTPQEPQQPPPVPAPRWVRVATRAIILFCAWSGTVHVLRSAVEAAMPTYGPKYLVSPFVDGVLGVAVMGALLFGLVRGIWWVTRA